MTAVATEREILNDYMGRPSRYGNVDGTIELYAGLLLLGWALTAWVGVHTPKPWRYLSLAPWMGLPIALFFGMRAVKQRVTWTRTGFVQLRTVPAKRWQTAVLLIVSNGILAALFQLYGGLLRPAVGFSACMVLLYAWLSRLNRPWKWAAALVIAGAGVALVASGVDFGKNPLLLPLVFGALMTATGTVSFWEYLRRTKPAAEAQE